MQNKTCCFVGHHPKSLPWGYSQSKIRFKIFKHRFKNKIEKTIKNGYNHFITSLSLGVEMLAAELVLELKAKYPNLTLECAIPCLNQSQNWYDENILRYQNIQMQADKVSIISNTFYYNGCIAKCKKYMLENSSKIIAVYNGKNGITKQTIQMAKTMNLEIEIIKP